MDHRQLQSAPCLRDLCDEYARFNKRFGLNLGSADEHLFDENLSQDQRDWLEDFVRRWDAAAKIEWR